MTYRPPTIREARDLTERLYEAGLTLTTAAFAYAKLDTEGFRLDYNDARDALDVARTKLIEHLEQMARSERGAA